MYHFLTCIQILEDFFTHQEKKNQTKKHQESKKKKLSNSYVQEGQLK